MDTVKPLIFAALNSGSASYEIILAPLILAFLLAELLVIQYTKLLVEHVQRVIFANLLRLLNLQNEGHTKISGFTVKLMQLRTWSVK